MLRDLNEYDHENDMDILNEFDHQYNMDALAGSGGRPARSGQALLPVRPPAIQGSLNHSSKMFGLPLQRGEFVFVATPRMTHIPGLI